MTVEDAKKWFKVYYSQNREDLILEALLHDVSSGFYVDVGAHDPEYFSVTKLFYDNGWSGINIEPQKKYWNKLKKERPRDVNLNIALGEQKSELTFREYPDADGLSTFSEEMKKSYTDDSYLKNVTSTYNEYSIEAYTLNNVLKKYANDKKIHFLKIDVEGLEEQVIKGNDWKRFRPYIICIEANHIFHDWRKILVDAKYVECFDDGLNKYFIAKERYDEIIKKFNYSGRILSQFTVQSVPFNMFIKEINKLTLDNKKLNSIVKKQDEHIKKQDEHKKKIESELEKYSKKIVNTNRIRNILTNLKTGRDK